MLKPFLLGLLILLASASGCVDNDGEPPPVNPPSPSPAPIPIREPNNAMSCVRVFPVTPVDRDHAQTFLPDGFVAAESSTFFQAPGLPANRALLVTSGMRCETSQWSPSGYSEAMVGIFVEPPIVDGEPVPGEHFYELGRAVPAAQPGTQVLRETGWSLIGDTIEVTHTATPSQQGEMSIADAAGAVFTATTDSAPAKDDFTGTLHIRWWHQTANGTGFFEYAFAPDGYLGPGTCEARSGSLAAQVMQSTSCRGGLFMVGPPFDVEGSFRFDPT